MTEYIGTVFDDTMATQGAGDILRGAKGDDTLAALHGGATLYGGEDEDNLFSAVTTGVTKLFGDGGNDDLGGNDGRDILFGGDGDDFLLVTAGNDSLSGDAGTDTLVLFRLDQGSGIVFTLGAGGSGTITSPNFTGTTQFSGIEGLDGADHDDSLTGNNAANILFGEMGNDTLNGKGGADALIGGQGHDLLIGGAGTDLFMFDGGTSRREFGATADTVGDFAVADDGFAFNSRNFGGLTATGSGVTIGTATVFAVDAAQFVIQTTKVATSLATRLIYDQDDGLIYYDADGALGGYKSLLVADVGAGLALTAADFFVF